MNGMNLIATNTVQAHVPLDTEGMMRALRSDAARGAEFANQLRESAQQLVATALIMPVLQQMDSSALRPADGPFAKTIIEKRFGPLMHQHLADRITGSQSFRLVDAVVARFTRQGMEARG